MGKSGKKSTNEKQKLVFEFKFLKVGQF